MSHAWIALRAALYASGFVVLWVWVAGQVRAYDARLNWALPPLARPAGLLLAAAGAALGLSCVATFVAVGKGTPAPFDAPRRFVAVGPYRCVRNPMYLGAMGLLAGSGLVLRSPSIVLFTAVWWLIAHVFVLTYEEPALRSRFGATYDDYCSRVHRWIPRRPRPMRADHDRGDDRSLEEGTASRAGRG
jgi:protein-S-isoprenylcysteine O-methyltransferase Ste14